MYNAKVENGMTFQSSLFDDSHFCSNTVSRKYIWWRVFNNTTSWYEECIF